MNRDILNTHNEAAWDEDYQFIATTKLDSSLKKNTAFIKKIRIVTYDQHKSILNDIQTLSLEKYISEIASALLEGLTKVSKSEDMIAAVETVSALHGRFGRQFTPLLMVTILQNLSTVESKLKKNLLNLVMEFYLVSLFRTLKDCDEVPHSFGKSNQAIIVLVLRDVLSEEKTETLAIANSFVKKYWEIEFDPEVKKLIKDGLREYTLKVLVELVEQDRALKKLKIELKKAAIRTGRISEELEVELEQAVSVFEKFYNVCEFLCGALGISMPDFVEIEEESVIVLKKGHEVWDDVREREFYENVPDLDELLQNSSANTKDTQQLHASSITSFLEELSMSNEASLNTLSISFHNLNLNNKATKNRILRFFIDAQSHYKYYARFLKINQVPLKDVIDDFIEYLDSSFRSQITHTKMSFKNIYFFIEMIKFKLIPTHIIFHKIRTLTVRIKETNNMDILSVFYENVGRYLLVEHRELMIEMMDLLKDKQKMANLSINDKFAIKNLLNLINPSKVAKAAKKVASLEDQFIIRLIKVELNLQSVSLVSEILGDLNTPIVLEYLSRPEVVNYDNIPALAQLVKLKKPLFVRTIDSVVENIKRGLELNDYRLNRVRMSQVKFVAELFNVKLVTFKFVKDLLYKILTFGHPNKQPLPNHEISIDASNNYFRVQLCCLLLNSIKLDKAKKKYSELVRVFLIYFQYYLFCKQAPLPSDILFLLNDVYAKFSYLDVERFVSVRDAVLALLEVVQSVDVVSDGESDDESVEEVEESEESEESEEETEEVNIDQEKKYIDDFDRDFQKLLLDSYEAGKNKLIVNNKLAGSKLADISTESLDGLSFSLLTREKVRNLRLPDGNEFAVSILKEREDQKSYKQRIMDLALQQ